MKVERERIWFLSSFLFLERSDHAENYKPTDIELYYEIHGEGKPLVLISGLGYSSWQWHKMVPLLAQKFQVITFDNRGVGQSDKPAGPYTAGMLAQDTVGLLDALKIEKAVIAGIRWAGSLLKPSRWIFRRE
jgi:3-oxoadipate enol-lactonase